LILLVLTSFNGKYPEPLYYEVDFNDGVTHLWSRELYYNYNDIKKETEEQVILKYWTMNQDDIEYSAICLSYEESRIKHRQKAQDILNSIDN
jgi:hypothetical protein